MRLKAIVSYKGTNYFGFQIQPKENEISIQGEIQKVLARILSQDIKIYASGRTDRGVHALNQCFHFDLEKDSIDVYRLKHSMNCLLNDDIYIKSLEIVDSSFHARFSVVDKTYRYVINIGEYDPLNNELLFNLNKPLEVEIMKKASKLFLGSHSFHNFCCNDEDFIRTINSINIELKDQILTIDINGDGFRRYMVRMIVGTLIEVGLNHINEDKITYYLSEVNDKVNFKSPSCGLYLYQINYGGQ